MKPGKASLAAIFCVVFIDLIGFGIVIPVLPLYAERFGASALVIGLLLAIYSVMQTLFAPVLGRWSDRIGRRPVLLMSVLGSSAGFLLMGWANGLPLLFLARIIDGITGGNISTAQAYIADITPPSQRSRGMGLIGAAFGLGFIFGPAIGGIMSRISLSAPFYFAAGLAAVNAVAIFFFLPESLAKEHQHQARRRSPVRDLFQEAKGSSLRVVLGIYFLTTVAFSLLTATYPLFAARRFDYQAEQVGYLFACMGLLGAVIQGGMMGWLGRFFREATLARAGMLLLAGGFFSLPFCRDTGSFFLATGILAAGHSLVVVPLNGLASRSSGPTAQGRVLGLMQSSASIGRIAGPVMGGCLLHWDSTRLPAQFGRSAFGAAGVLVVMALGLASLMNGSAKGA